MSTTTSWSDYVFNEDYNLRSLEEVSSYIKEHKHLPDVPSAVEVVKEGIDIAEMNAILLRKIEELTLYTLDLQKRVAEQADLLTDQNKKVEKLAHAQNKHQRTKK